MKKGKSKAAQQQHSADQKNDQCDKESTKRHVYVEPGVQIDLIEDLKKDYKSANTETTAHNRKQLLWTRIGAGLVFLYTLFTLWQVYLSRQLARTAQDQLVSSERAYVSFKGLGESIRKIQGGNIIGDLSSLQFENSGSTPVPQGVFWVGHGLYPNGLPQDFSFPFDQGEHTFTIPPKGTTTIDYGFPIDVLQTIRDGKSRYFLWGTVVYRDIFPDDPPRVTEFCLEVQGLLKTGGGVVDINDPNSKTVFKVNGCAPPATHACYDDQCADYESLKKRK